MSNGKPWLPAHTLKMRELHAKKCTDDVIALETGHCVNTVGDHRRAAGLPANHPSLYAPWEAIPAISRRAIRAACDRLPDRGRRTRCAALQ